mgnify:CR=1 FL=1
MCNNNGLCGCLNNNWWWIVILILLLCNCGGWNGWGCSVRQNNPFVIFAAPKEKRRPTSTT